MSIERNEEKSTVISEMAEAECDCCGFWEQSKFMKSFSGEKFLCRECAVYIEPEIHANDFVAVFMSDITARAISILFKTKVALSLFKEAWSEEFAIYLSPENSPLDDDDRIELIDAFRRVSRDMLLPGCDSDSPMPIAYLFDEVLAKINDIFKVDAEILTGEQLIAFLSVRRAMSPEDRMFCDLSLRYIPIRFLENRALSWKNGWLKKHFEKAILSLINIVENRGENKKSPATDSYADLPDVFVPIEDFVSSNESHSKTDEQSTPEASPAKASVVEETQAAMFEAKEEKK